MRHTLDNHQMHNARQMEDKVASWYLNEREATPAALAQLLEKILTDPKKLEKTAQNLHALGVTTATQAMTDAVEDVLNQ